MLDAETRETIKATVPVLQSNGQDLTAHFYERLFTHNPEMKQVFNQGHQVAGAQQEALAGAVAAYAANIDDPTVLLPVLERVGNKHVSLGVRPEHYGIIGQHLLASIEEVLGTDTATPEVIDAWAAAYGELVGLMTGIEQGFYDMAAAQAGGWTGWRGFRVARKEPESEEITSFYLVPADGGAVPQHKPGQYITIRVMVPELGYYQPRQYSLSAAPGRDELRISVKRERNEDGPDGMVSNLLHDTLEVGDVIDVAPPAGDIFLNDDETPLVLISAGVGITPMMAMLDHAVAAQPDRPVRFLHSCRHGGVHAFDDHLDAVASQHPHVEHAIWYSRPRDDDEHGVDHDHIGRMDLTTVQDWAVLPDAEYHICGPKPFITAQRETLLSLGVPQDRIYAEVFGTGGV